MTEEIILEVTNPYTITLIGLVIVFVALGIVSLFIKLVEKFDLWFQKQERLEETASERRAVLEPSIDSHTLAIIAASTCAVLGKKVRIRKIRPIARSRNTWATVGRMAIMGSHALTKGSKKEI